MISKKSLEILEELQEDERKKKIKFNFKRLLEDDKDIKQKKKLQTSKNIG